MFHVLPNRIPWFVAGPLISLLVVGLYAVMNKPLGASGAYVNVATVFGTGWAIAETCPAPALAMLASGSVLAPKIHSLSQQILKHQNRRIFSDTEHYVYRGRQCCVHTQFVQ